MVEQPHRFSKMALEVSSGTTTGAAEVFGSSAVGGAAAVKAAKAVVAMRKMERKEGIFRKSDWGGFERSRSRQKVTWSR